MRLPVKHLCCIAECCLLFVARQLRPFRYVLKRFRKKSRVIWSGTPIITMAVKAKAECLLGANAKSLVFETYSVTNAFDYNLSKWFSFPFIGRFTPFIVLLWVCLFVDRLHFYCDRGILPPIAPLTFDTRELKIYRLMGIPVFLYTYGADVRTIEETRILGEPNCCTECESVGTACICTKNRKDENIARLSDLVRTVFCMGDMCEYVPFARKDLFYWPVDIEGEAQKYRPVYPEAIEEGPLRIVHATNHRQFKGTHFLEEAVKDLRMDGFDVELCIVEKTSNLVALDMYRSADIVFDQCLVGFHGYFALESMAMGKPVMCFIRKPAEYLLSVSECPIINTNMYTLKDDIRALYRDRMTLRSIGVRSRQYVEKYFSLRAFAERLHRSYKEIGIEI